MVLQVHKVNGNMYLIYHLNLLKDHKVFKDIQVHKVFKAQLVQIQLFKALQVHKVL